MPDSAFGWTLTDFLLADLFHATTGKPHPLRPEAVSRAERHTALVARLRAQRERLTTQEPNG